MHSGRTSARPSLAAQAPLVHSGRRPDPGSGDWRERGGLHHREPPAAQAAAGARSRPACRFSPITHEGNEAPHNVSWLDYQDYRSNPVFQDLAAYDIGFVGLSTDQRAERIAVSYVTEQLLFDARRDAGGQDACCSPARDCTRARTPSSSSGMPTGRGASIVIATRRRSPGRSSTASRSRSPAWCRNRSRACTRWSSSTRTCPCR